MTAISEVPKLNLKFREVGKLTLKLTKKDKNSPLLSISNYIKRFMIHNKSRPDVKTLWKAYYNSSSNDVLIRTHNITYDVFVEIANSILESYDQFEVKVVIGSPVLRNDSKFKLPVKTRIENEDLVELEL